MISKFNIVFIAHVNMKIGLFLQPAAFCSWKPQAAELLVASHNVLDNIQFAKKFFLIFVDFDDCDNRSST